MYIDFDEYPRYSGRNYEFFGKMLMKIFSVFMVMHVPQANRKCAHALMNNWGMMKTCFPDAKQINKFQKKFYENNVHMFKKI